MPAILIADDEPHMLRLLELSLRKTGCELRMVGNGRELLEAAQALQPVLIVSDVSMPEMDGLAALACLKQSERTRSIPVIMLTAKGQPLTRLQAERSGANVFLTKPFSPTELLQHALRLIAPPPAAPAAARSALSP